MPETLQDRIARHEGLKLQVYKDSLGKLTIGYGRLIEAPGGLSDEEAHMLLSNDIDKAEKALSAALPWATGLDYPRWGVMVEMVFQLGVNGLLKFKNTLAAVKSGDFGAAAKLMLDSLWATQTPIRAKELAEIMKTGKLDI